MVAVVILVLVVVIVLRRLVSNNKMKREREKTYVRPKRCRRCLLGPFFCLPEGGSGSPSLGSVVLGVFSASPVHSRRRLLPPVAHSHRCYVTSTISIHNPAREQRLAAVVLSAGFLFFRQ
jgi:hypothetical protein